MDIIEVKRLIDDKKNNVLIPMIQSMSENFAKAFETGVEVGIEIGRGLNPNYASVWHSTAEEPNERAECLIEWRFCDVTRHQIGLYHSDRKRFDIIEMDKVIKWAYIKDLV